MTMDRYSIIREKNPREIVLLRGRGCRWRRCRFCDYHMDFSKDDDANLTLNRSVLSNVTGIYGTLEAINSGSFCDLDDGSIEAVLDTCRSRGISQLHIECHWRDRDTLHAIRSRFNKSGILLKVKTGVETFDEIFRDDVLLKGMEHASPEDIAAYADEVCLLFGLTGQTEQSMRGDVETGLRFFERVCVNLMTENSTDMYPDREVLDIFMKNIYPAYRDDPRVDILIENTDFGVGGNNDAK